MTVEFFLGVVAGAVITGAAIAVLMITAVVRKEKEYVQNRPRVEKIPQKQALHSVRTGPRPVDVATPGAEHRERRIHPGISYAGQIQRVESKTPTGEKMKTDDEQKHSEAE